MNRRDFIARLLGTAAGAALGATLDLDKLLWVPKPIITVPANFKISGQHMGLLFSPKYYEVSVPMYLEELEIIQAGQVADLLAADYLHVAKNMARMLG